MLRTKLNGPSSFIEMYGKMIFMISVKNEFLYKYTNCKFSKERLIYLITLNVDSYSSRNMKCLKKSQAFRKIFVTKITAKEIDRYNK